MLISITNFIIYGIPLALGISLFFHYLDMSFLSINKDIFSILNVNDRVNILIALFINV